MSRHSFFPKDGNSSYVVVVGWDAGLQSFFLQYGDPGSELLIILATGQRVAEHPGPYMVVALARHLGDRIPDDLAQTLEADRKAEGEFDGATLPDHIMQTTQADNGAQIGFILPRDAVPDLDLGRSRSRNQLRVLLLFIADRERQTSLRRQSLVSAMLD